jgi:hypothetical protein
MSGVSQKRDRAIAPLVWHGTVDDVVANELMRWSGGQKARDGVWPVTERVFEIRLVAFRKTVTLRKTGSSKPVGPIVTDGEPAELMAISQASPELVILGFGVGLGDGPPGRVAAVGGLKRAEQLSRYG